MINLLSNKIKSPLHQLINYTSRLLKSQCFFTFALFAFGSTSSAWDASTYSYHRSSSKENSNNHILHYVSKMTLMLHHLTSMHINQFW